MRVQKFSRIDASLVSAICLAFYLLFSMVSISLSQICLAAALLSWLVSLTQKRRGGFFPAFFWPLLVYACFSILSSLFSVNPEVSLKDSRDLLLLLIVPITYTGFQRMKNVRWANTALLISGYICILYSLYYYFFKAAPAERIMGFMSHYMTQAGLLLLFLSFAFGMSFFLKGASRLPWIMALPLGLFTLALTLTRSAWIGVVVAVAVILVLYKPLTLILLPVAVGLFFIFSPGYVQHRVLSIFGLKNYWNVQRLEYLRVGTEIIKEYPIFGTGPDTVEMVFQDPKYGLSYEAKQNVHLHNNIMQIGAERGIPALLAWLAWLALALLGLIKLLKNKDPTLYPLTTAALAALLALFAAGLFEYNFGDSEVITLFLYLLTCPFIVARILNKQVRTKD